MSADRCVKWDDDGGVVVGWTVLAALMRAVTVEVPDKFGIFGRRFRARLRPRLGVIETPSGDG